MATRMLSRSALRPLPTSSQVRRMVKPAAAATSQEAGTARPIHVVGISGSLRKDSKNTGMLKAAAKHVPPGATFEILDISQLPLYNDDLWQRSPEAAPTPEAVVAFRSKLEKADGVFFATPEYNHSVSGPLKNAIDWASGGMGGSNVWLGKVVAIAAAAGISHGARSSLALELILRGVGCMFYPPPPPPKRSFIFTSAFGPAFDKEGNVVDKDLEARCADELAQIVNWVTKLRQIQ